MSKPHCQYKFTGKQSSKTGRYQFKCDGCGTVIWMDEMEAPRGNCPGIPLPGPGTELAIIFKSINLNPVPGCRCAELMFQMNSWGVEGCRVEVNRTSAILQLKEDAKLYDWTKHLEAATRTIVTGQVFKFTSVEGMYDEAVDRTEQKIKLLMELPPLKDV